VGHTPDSRAPLAKGESRAICILVPRYRAEPRLVCPPKVEGKVDEAGDRYTPETNLTLPVRENLDALGRSTIFWERLRAVALALRKAATDHLDRSIPDGALAEKRPYRSARRRVQRLQRLAAIPGFRIELQGDSRRDGGR
jgi:hypothetical protein